MKHMFTRNLVGRLATSIFLLTTVVANSLLAHTCPPTAAATGVGVTVTALRTNGVPIGGNTVAPCEPIILRMSILYFPIDPITGGDNAAFEGGQMILKSPGRFDANVTPVGGVPLLGPPECFGLGFLASQAFPYTVTEADALAGTIPILAAYTNGNAHIGSNDLIAVVSGTQGFTVRVRPGVSCSIAPNTDSICAGATATFTASATNGNGPFTFRWSGPNGFTFTGPVLTLSNAQPSQSGTYNVVVTDLFGCTNTCSASLTVRPAPTCTISGPTTVCHPTNATFTSIVSPSGLNPTFKWTVTGSGTIVGPDNQASVVVQSTSSGSYTVSSAIVADGCSNSCSQTVTVRMCIATISLVKEIVCWTPNGCDPFTGSDTATGARAGNQCPSFCYRITISNTSPAGVELRNIIVTDNQISLSSCTFPTVLGENGSPTASFSCVISNVTHCQNQDSTATVTGTGFDTVTGGVIGNVGTNDSTHAVVVPIAIICDKLASSPDDLNVGDGPRTVTLPTDSAPHPVTYGVVVSNASTLPLIAFIADPTLANCPLPPEFSTGIALAPGEVRLWPSICVANLQCGVDPLDEGTLVNTIHVRATVNTALTNVCPYTHDGSQVTASNTCQASVSCSRPAGCRVTGGGRQDADSGRGSLVFPLHGGGIDCMGDLTVRYVTHGGQVGAPVGRPSEFDPDSDCIEGNWEHVRHAQGGRRANFHAKSFDSLMCACLAEGSNPGTVVGELCNPDDKKNGLGPQPRKAPANKIAFSGVGDYTCNKGGREPRSVLFRVDIEDRSEPGGFHPGGAKDPADRYRIRIWVLTSQELAALRGSPSSVNDPFLCNFRRAIAATTVNTPLTDGAIDNNGDAVALGTAVFGVRAPDVDDGGELQHGNHQIHPQIKDCTAPVHTCPAAQ